jgi:hypothetical protein
MANCNGENKMVHYDDVFLNINAKCNNNKYVRYKGMQSINQSSPPSPHTLRHKSDQQPNCENRNDPDLVQAFLKKWWVESDFKAPNK